MKQTKYKLKNGLKVLLIESHKSPVISVQMWVKNGSADEKKNEEGISHFIEHLVFKGTEKFKTGEIASIVEGSGGELNAYTSFDQTVFYVTISKNFADTALDVISEMMGRPIFDPQEIDNEREVVIEEIKRGNDSPSRRSSQLMFETNYKKHPYGIPVIGYDRNIKKLSPKKIVDFYRSRYNPSNMFLVIAGDFSTPEMKKKVLGYFSDFKPYKLRKVKRTAEPKQKTPRLVVKASDFEETMAYLAWPGVNVKSKDVPALDVLALILGQGDSSRLVHRLRVEQPLVNSVGAFNYTPQDQGLFALSLGLKGTHLKETLDIVLQELKLIMTQAPSSQEMQKALTNISSEEVYGMETVDGVARKAGSNEFYMGDHKAHEKYLREILRLKPEQIVKVARKYLRAENLNFSVMTKENIKEIEKVVKNFQVQLKALCKEIAKAKIQTQKFKPNQLKLQKSSLKDSDIKVHTTASGVRVLFQRQSDTPTISSRFVFMGGSRVDSLEKAGRAELFSRVWMAGTKNYSEPQIYASIESLAAGLSPFSGKNTVGISLDMMSNAQEEMLNLVEEVILHPLLSQESLSREVKVLLHQLQSRKDNPSFLCGKMFSESIFKGHPYSIDAFGDEKTLIALTSEDLKTYYREVITAKNLTVCVVGDADEKLWLSSIEKIGKSLKPGHRISNRFTVEPMKADVHRSMELKKEQSHVIVGFPGLVITDSRRYALQVLQSVLSGMGGRLFNELREKNSLAYSVSPLKMEGIDAGYFGAYIGCSPEKVDKAIEMMMIEFKKLVDHKVSEDELARAKRYLVGRHDIELQRKSSLCSTVIFDDVYGNDFKENLDVAKAYGAVTAQEVQDLAREIFSKPKVISIVGPKLKQNDKQAPLERELT